MKKVAVILSGCGVYDGSEIYETVLTLLAIEQNNAHYRCFAPNITQHHVVNHLTGEVDDSDQRNVLVESARLARGDIENIAELRVNDFDALILPGGFGAAKNLSDFAIKGADCQVNAQVKAVCQGFAEQNKPAGYICIAPAMLPIIYGGGVSGTVGRSSSTSDMIVTMGLNHCDCEVNDIVVDVANKVVSTPAYMLATTISEAASGINKLVKKVIELA